MRLVLVLAGIALLSGCKYIETTYDVSCSNGFVSKGNDNAYVTDGGALYMYKNGLSTTKLFSRDTTCTIQSVDTEKED